MKEFGTALLGLAQNFSLILSLAFLYTLLIPGLNKLSHLKRAIIISALFSGIALLGILLHITIIPGVIMDGRMVAVSTAGLIGGLFPALLTAIILIVIRILIGGAGVYAGIGAIATGAVIGIIAHYVIREKPARYSLLKAFLMGLAIVPGSLLWIFILPANNWLIFQRMILPVLIFSPLATLTIIYLIRNEHQKLEQQEIIEEDQNRFHGLFENSPVSILELDLSRLKAAITDLNIPPEEIQSYFKKYPEKIKTFLKLATIIAVNPKTLEMHRAQSKKEFISRFGEVLTDDFCNHFPRYIETIARNETEFVIDTRVQDFQGKPIEVTIFWSVFPGHKDRYDRVIVNTIDITRRQMLEEQLRQSQKMDAIGQLAGGIAHDFNNMLGGITGAAQLLQSPIVPLNEKGEKYVNTILKAARNAADLTQKLLAFSRQQPILSRSIEFNQLITDTLTLLSRTLDKQITIKTNLSPLNNTISGDESTLQNMLINLCINAAHAMPEGGTLTLSTKNIRDVENCFIQLTVNDTGCGIPVEIQHRVFEPFFTTKDVGTGTGLGLSAVYGTVSDHNGHIDLHSIPGEGTTFTITLPCNTDSTSPSLPAEPPSGEQNISPSERTILVVDDEEVVLEMTRELLEDLGYKTLGASGGLEALKQLQNHTIDLIILDIIMPGMNGREVYLKLRESNRELPVILSSGFTRDEPIEDLLKNRKTTFLPKPYQITKLEALLQELLG